MKKECKYVFDGFKNLSSPISVNLEVTPLCNLRCLFCYVSDRRKNRLATDDSLQISINNKIFSIIDRIKDAEVFNLTLLGGEIFYINEWHDIFRYSAEKGFELGFVSNGTLITEDIAKTLVKYVGGCSISIHGHSPEIHDKITGVKGSFKKTLRGIHNCLDSGLKTGISFTPISLNYDCIYETVRLINNEFNERIDTFVINRPTLKGTPKHLQGYLSLDIGKMLVSFEQGLKISEDFNMYVEMGDSFPFCKIDKKFWKLISPCAAGTTFAGIDCEGNVRLCPSSDKSIGNVFHNSLKEIWQTNNKILEFRESAWLPAECKKCEMIYKCRGGCYISCNDAVYFGKDQFM